jgi:ubiquinone/menaquinone biosynthesis C-methylase UbiE
MSEKHVEKVQAVFDDWAKSGRADTMEAGHTPNARRAFDALGLKAGQHYLDVGCGNGYTVRWAAEKDPTIQAVGVDVAEGMVRHARSLSTSFSNARFIHAEFPLPELKSQCFDAIFSMEVFYYLPELTWALQHVRRLLKPNGVFISTVDFYSENPASHSWPKDVGLKMNLLSMAEWKAAMEEVGLSVEKQEQLKMPLGEGETSTWQHSVGSLMTLARRVE